MSASITVSSPPAALRPPARPLRSIAVVGAGLAGARCAARLREAGLDVTVFDKARGVGGRMATRRLRWLDDERRERWADFDHGAPCFEATHPAFRAWLVRAREAGVVVPWRPLLHAAWPPALDALTWLPVPGMPALAAYALAGVPLRLEQQVVRLQQHPAGWSLHLAGGDTAGPYDAVVLAMPPAQAAALLEGQQPRWPAELAAWPMLPCWTVMAITDDQPWPWDAALPETGPLAWVARNDYRPGRMRQPGHAFWVAQATADWTASFLEEDPSLVAYDLCEALAGLLPRGRATRWFHTGAHRWRYAQPAQVAAATGGAKAPARPPRPPFRLDAGRGLAVCGDYLAGGTVEAAWLSGDALATALMQTVEAGQPAVLAA